MFIQKILKGVGLYYVAKSVQSLVKLPPSSMARELRYRFGRGPDGYATPPSKLIFLVVAHASATQYYEGGKTVMDNTLRRLEESSIDIHSCKNILDFGCGCGRMIRQLSSLEDVNLYGTDYNQLLVDWCQKNLTFAQFQTNQLAPPMDYEDQTFDLVYQRSVFTHLDDSLQKAWMKEFARLIEPGGTLLFSTHGEQFLHLVSAEERAEYDAGNIVTWHMDIEGSNTAASFQSPDYVKKELLVDFELVNFFPGEKQGEQDIYIVRRLAS